MRERYQRRDVITLSTTDVPWGLLRVLDATAADLTARWSRGAKRSVSGRTDRGKFESQTLAEAAQRLETRPDSVRELSVQYRQKEPFFRTDLTAVEAQRYALGATEHDKSEVLEDIRHEHGGYVSFDFSVLGDKAELALYSWGPYEADVVGNLAMLSEATKRHLASGSAGRVVPSPTTTSTNTASATPTSNAPAESSTPAEKDRRRLITTGVRDSVTAQVLIGLAAVLLLLLYVLTKEYL